MTKDELVELMKAYMYVAYESSFSQHPSVFGFEDAADAILRSQAGGNEPVAWQWRYVGDREWKTPSGGIKITDEELKREDRAIEQRPLYAAPTQSPPKKAHKVMTPEEYAAIPIIGWHEVCRDVDGFGAVGVRYIAALSREVSGDAA